MLLSTNSSVCVRPENCPPTPSPDLCHPVLAISVPIRVVARGMDFCPSQGMRNNDFTRFLTSQIVRRYRANATECRLEAVQRTNCVGKLSQDLHCSTTHAVTSELFMLSSLSRFPTLPFYILLHFYFLYMGSPCRNLEFSTSDCHTSSTHRSLGLIIFIVGGNHIQGLVIVTRCTGT